VISLQQGLV